MSVGKCDPIAIEEIWTKQTLFTKRFIKDTLEVRVKKIFYKGMSIKYVVFGQCYPYVIYSFVKHT